MPAFYFDIGGVLIPDGFAPDRAQNVFHELAQRHGFEPNQARVTFTSLVPALDLGTLSLAEFCAAVGMDHVSFERDWLAMHPLDGDVVRIIEQLLERGNSVGLASNICRRLLDLLLERTPALARLSVCCSADFGLVKPSAGFFRRASQIMPASETIFVDDRLVNIEAARSFGWTAMQATPGWLRRFEQMCGSRARS